MPRGSTEMGRRGGIGVGGQGTARLRGPPGLAGPVSGSRGSQVPHGCAEPPLLLEVQKGQLPTRLQTQEAGSLPALLMAPQGDVRFQS